MEIFYDVETQIDFMDKGRPMYTPGVEIIKPALKKLTQYAKNNNIMIAGGLDVHFGTPEYKHREVELQLNGGPFPMHGEKDSEGMQKIPETDFGGVRHPHYLDEHVDRKIFDQGIRQRGIIFEKQMYDIFTNPAITEFIKYAGVKKAKVYGVLTDWCVKDAVLGMQKNGVQTYVVRDAIYALNANPGDEENAIREMEKAGAKMVSLEDVLGGRV